MTSNLLDHLVPAVMEAPHGKRLRLASGAETDWYADLRHALLSSGLAMRVAAEELHALLPDEVRSIGGVPTGGLPLLGALLPVCHVRDDPALPPRTGFYVRAEAKAHGMGRRVEGHLRGVACLVEDTVTSGGSALRNALAAREEGGDVRYVLAVLDREEGAAENLRAHGITLLACVRGSELLNAARQGGAARPER